MSGTAASTNARPARNRRGAASRWAVFAGCVLFWQLLASSVGSTYFPPPLRIVTAAGQKWLSSDAGRLFLSPAAYADVLPSVGRLLLGWLLAAVIGIGMGVLLGRSRTAMAYLGALLSFARSVPPPALVPVFLVLFQLGFRMQLATIVFGSVWPVLLNATDGARAVDPVREDTARAFRMSRRQWVFGVVVPSSLPQIFAGLRISLSLAMTMMVVSELVGATDGIGHSMQVAKDGFDYTTLWAGIVLLGVLGYALNSLLLAAQGRILGAGRPPQ